jgi:hypothetical protein
MASALDITATVFLIATLSFLLGTAAWFRLDHAAKTTRFKGRTSDDLILELQWQYVTLTHLHQYVINKFNPI